MLYPSIQALTEAAVPLQNLHQFFGGAVTVELLRLDLIHPEVSGNKFFKLRYYLQHALQHGQGILTLGGPWSNHILATAAACAASGIPSTGVISGEVPANPSPVLQRAKALGMDLHYLRRSTHRQVMQTFSQPAAPDSKHPPSDRIMQLPDPVKRLMEDPSWLLVPAGGYGAMGAAGAATILHPGRDTFTHLVAAVGTGTMLAGLINATTPGQQVIGVPVLKGVEDLHAAVSRLLLHDGNNWRLEDGYQFGGYARYTGQLIEFMNRFYAATGVPLDFVYTGKMMFALDQLIRDERFPAGSRIMAIHSGGLAGNAGLPNGTLIW